VTLFSCDFCTVRSVEDDKILSGAVERTRSTGDRKEDSSPVGTTAELKLSTRKAEN